MEVFATIGNGQVTLFPPSNLGRFMYWRRFELVCKHLTLGDNGQPDDKLRHWHDWLSAACSCFQQAIVPGCEIVAIESIRSLKRPVV